MCRVASFLLAAVVLCPAAALPQPPALSRLDFREVIRNAKAEVVPAVVYIKVVRKATERGEKGSLQVAGSGVIVSPEGEVITNWHVIEKAITVRCLLSDGQAMGAEVIGSDKDTDLALLQLDVPADGAPLPYAHVGDSTVLVEGDDINEPVSDALRGVLDGHIWMPRDLANRGHYPAISVLESISRVMPDVATREHVESVAIIRRVLAVWYDIEDLVNVGAYSPGSNVEFDIAVKMKPSIDKFLQQAVDECATFGATVERLAAIASEIGKLREKLESRSEKPAEPPLGTGD